MGQAKATSSFLPKETEGGQLLLAVGKLEILNSDEESGIEAGVSEKQENCLHIDVLHNSIPTDCMRFRFETCFCFPSSLQFQQTLRMSL